MVHFLHIVDLIRNLKKEKKEIAINWGDDRVKKRMYKELKWDKFTLVTILKIVFRVSSFY